MCRSPSAGGRGWCQRSRRTNCPPSPACTGSVRARVVIQMFHHSEAHNPWPPWLQPICSYLAGMRDERGIHLTSFAPRGLEATAGCSCCSTLLVERRSSAAIASSNMCSTASAVSLAEHRSPCWKVYNHFRWVPNSMVSCSSVIASSFPRS